VSKNLNSICSAFLNQFVDSNKMLWLDVMDGECDYTYHNDANQHYSLLDYFLTSPSLVDGCQSVKILCDGDNPSDHLAISCTINVALGTTRSFSTVLNNMLNFKLRWQDADLNLYAKQVCELLAQVDIPTDALLCHNSCSADHIRRHGTERSAVASRRCDLSPKRSVLCQLESISHRYSRVPADLMDPCSERSTSSTPPVG